MRVRRDINTLNMLHKIKRNSPHYLSDVIPATRQQTTARTLRNSSNISLPPNRIAKSSFKNSFFPATIRRWNKLPEEVKTVECIRSFKQAIAQLFELTKPPLYYSLGHKIDNVLHTRLRLDLSGLNAHLYKINSPQVDSPNCRCEPSPETVKHYFFFCPKYVVQRTELERSLINYIKDYVKLTINDKLAILVFGHTFKRCCWFGCGRICCKDTLETLGVSLVLIDKLRYCQPEGRVHNA